MQGLEECWEDGVGRGEVGLRNEMAKRWDMMGTFLDVF